ncbi:MAG: hypothetical protein IPG90_00260 [Bacteroidetes bacterium]|nr:hypothetical protein [Bacteroidota bacterium]MBK6836875.1 hypothetical protein [Bacteroidota bacterium]MBK9523720.1 hypothetical protein [Bacteroidota bacterium]MBK9541465.1 hypothetical protein [Bacteroidota bacterium]MBP6403868.1 hypothetical protein [Bacteroidia bacterium]
MDILNSIVAGMSKDQVRYFKVYLNRSHDRDDRLDIQLFDYMRKSGEEYDEERIFKKLYGSEDKNSFYRLRNRLLQDLNKSTLIQHYDDDETGYTLHLLALEKFYFSRNNTRVANYFLKKAESEARKTENFELLDIVYGDFIRLSHELLSINPEEYIQKRKDNQEQIRQLRAIDDILAVVSYKMKLTQNFSADENPILPLLQETVENYSNDKELIRSAKLRFRIYHAVTQILLQKRDYKALEEYLLSIYKEFTEEKLFVRTNHDTKLQMLVYLVNSLFKNNKLKESLLYTEQLRSAMEEYQRMYYDKYLFFYYNSLVINYSRLDRNRAIEILDEMKGNEKIVSNPFYEMFVYLNLAVSWFDKKDFHQSIRNLNKLYLLKGYENADRSLQFKIAIAELMIRYELKDFDVLENKIRQVKKDFKEFFTRQSNSREILMVNVIGRLIESDSLKNEKGLIAKVKQLIFESETEDAGDSEILNYKTWLKEKLSM